MAVVVQQRQVAPATRQALRLHKVAMAVLQSVLARLTMGAAVAAVHLLRAVREHQPLAVTVVLERPQASLVGL